MMAENAVEKEGDSASSTELTDDDYDKTEPEPIKLLCLLRFGDRAREASGHHGISLEDLLALAEQVRLVLLCFIIIILN